MVAGVVVVVVVAGATVVVAVAGAVVVWLNSSRSWVVETWEELALPQAVTVNKIVRPRCRQRI